MKKTKVSMLVIATLVMSSTISFGVTGKVNTDTARMRSEASSESSIIDLLSEDDKVEVIQDSGDWYKITVGEKTGYISKSLVDVEDEVTEGKKQEETEPTATTIQETETNETNETNETTESNETENKNQEQQEVIEEPKIVDSIIKETFKGSISSEITIKILPSINSIDIAKIEKGEEITILEVINNWCHIETSNFSGWALIKKAEDAIAPSEETTETVEEEEQQEETTDTETENETNKTGYVNVESVNLRKEKSTESDILDSVTKNTKVTIIGEEDNWYKVKVDNYTGYIAKQYISDKKVEEVTSRASDTARQIMESKEESQEQQETVSSARATSAEGNDVVSFAKQYLGYSYVSGGKSPSSGFDCSGFTSYVYKQFGVSLSGSSTGQRNAGTSVSKSDLQPGDLLIFNNSSNSSVGHVGIYIGDNQFIHAANAKKGVITTSLSDSYYSARYVDGRRVVE